MDVLTVEQSTLYKVYCDASEWRRTAYPTLWPKGGSGAETPARGRPLRNPALCELLTATRRPIALRRASPAPPLAYIRPRIRGSRPPFSLEHSCINSCL